MKRIIVLIIGLSLLVTSCRKKPIDDIEPSLLKPEEYFTPMLEEKLGKPSPLSGIYVDEELINKRILAVMFDNHPKARWQAGLKEAEIVFEMPVEPPYTRYMGLYLVNSPENIGPIRSARPYFVTKALEYDGIYAHVGGSTEAKEDIKKLSIADIDGLTSSNKVFYRQSHKKMPHNLYTNMEVLRATGEERAYRTIGNHPTFKFYEDDTPIDGALADRIRLNYAKDNKTEYIYNSSRGDYTRIKDGQVHIDENDKSEIRPKNIIVQYADIKVIDNEGRLKIDLIGQGRGKYITLGSVRDIVWKKSDRASETKYYYGDMEEIRLNPGQTWIQIIDVKKEIEIDY